MAYDFLKRTGDAKSWARGDSSLTETGSWLVPAELDFTATVMRLPWKKIAIGAGVAAAILAAFATTPSHPQRKH